MKISEIEPQSQERVSRARAISPNEMKELVFIMVKPRPSGERPSTAMGVSFSLQRITRFDCE